MSTRCSTISTTKSALFHGFVQRQNIQLSISKSGKIAQLFLSVLILFTKFSHFTPFLYVLGPIHESM